MSLVRKRLAQFGAILVAVALCQAPPARAADRIYWANGVGSLSFVNLDASAGGDLTTTGATMNGPRGIALDPAAGRIYWANAVGNKISFANLNGTGGGDLTTTGATVNGPYGVAVDPAAGRIYWANSSVPRISFANLNGTGGGDLTTTGATVNSPLGVAVDPAARRIYWANNPVNKISFANLNGTGGGDLTTTGATVSDPVGVAVDPAAGRIYWASYTGAKISFANLDGSGAGDLPTTGATVSGPYGVAVDAAAGRIYWANFGGNNKISFARLNGTGGGDLPTLAATVAAPTWPALLKAPRPAGAPAVTGGSAPGSTLSCSRGSWAPNLVASLVYSAPRSFAFGWSRNGAALAGARTSSYTATSAGDYRCAVTASNEAGGATQTSAPHTVSATSAPAPRAFGAKTRVTLKLAVGRIAANGPLSLRIANSNAFTITGRLSGQTTNKVSASSRRRVKLKAKSFRIAANSRKTIKLKLPKTLRRLLKRQHKLSLGLTATIKDPAGHTRRVRQTVKPKLKPKRRRSQ